MLPLVSHMKLFLRISRLLARLECRSLFRYWELIIGVISSAASRELWAVRCRIHFPENRASHFPPAFQSTFVDNGNTYTYKHMYIHRVYELPALKCEMHRKCSGSDQMENCSFRERSSLPRVSLGFIAFRSDGGRFSQTIPSARCP